MKTAAEDSAKETLKNAGIWIRVSTEDQVKGESPTHHLERARAYAAAKGWAVQEVYNLAGVSGKSVKDHPEAKRMIRDAKSGHINALIFSKLARLARNTKELLEFADIFRACGADLISLQETIDTSTPSGRLFFTMIAAMAEWEREEIAERVSASVSVRAKLGKPLGGPSPFGYKWENKKLVLNSSEAPIRKKIYELFAEHRRKGVVAKALNSAGYRTRKGCRWSDIAVGRLIRCPSAKGVYYLNRTHQTGNWTWEEKPESEWGVLSPPAIVSEDLWQLCNRMLEEQNKHEKRPGKKTVHLFAGLAYCACGQKMYVKANSPKYICEKCRNKIPIVDLEGIFQEEIRDFFASPAHVDRLLVQANQGLKDKEELLASHRSAIQKLREEMARTHRLYLDNHLTGQGFAKLYKPAEERLNQLEAELPTLAADVDFRRVTSLSTAEVVSEAELLHKRWPEMPVENKRKIVESIVERITIGKDEIDIKLSFIPSSEELTKNQQALLRP